MYRHVKLTPEEWEARQNFLQADFDEFLSKTVDLSDPAEVRYLESAMPGLRIRREKLINEMISAQAQRARERPHEIPPDYIFVDEDGNEKTAEEAEDAFVYFSPVLFRLPRNHFLCRSKEDHLRLGEGSPAPGAQLGGGNEGDAGVADGVATVEHAVDLPGEADLAVE